MNFLEKNLRKYLKIKSVIGIYRKFDLSNLVFNRYQQGY